MTHGLGLTVARIMQCTPSEDRSLDSNLHAQQQGLALRRSVSSERSLPQLQILNRKGAIQYDSDAIAIAVLRKASPSTIFKVFTVVRCYNITIFDSTATWIRLKVDRSQHDWEDRVRHLSVEHSFHNVKSQFWGFILLSIEELAIFLNWSWNPVARKLDVSQFQFSIMNLLCSCPAKITLWASTWLQSSQTRVTSAKLLSFRISKSSTLSTFYFSILNPWSSLLNPLKT